MHKLNPLKSPEMIFLLAICYIQHQMLISSQYTRDGFVAALKMNVRHPALRPIAKYFIPEVRRIWAHNATAFKFLAPIIMQRMKDENTKGYVKLDDTVEWLRDILSNGEKEDYEFQAISQLRIRAASIDTTSQAVANTISNLAAYPAYFPILREEIEIVLAQNNGEWNLERMGRGKKMDCFMKESQRHGGATPIAFQRKALKLITLSDGTYIPAGTNTCGLSGCLLRPHNFKKF